MSEFNVEVLHENIHVYHNAFPNPNKFIEDSLAINDWRSWYIFGDILYTSGHPMSFDRFPLNEDWDYYLKNADLNDVNKIAENVFYEVTKHYIEATGYTQENWRHGPPAVCKYTGGQGVSNDLIMHYHTDFEQAKAEEPGDKHSLTCTMYLNDDYVGGEIAFKIFENDSYTHIVYKPQAGDILVFPSADPYYHGVKKIESGTKFFIRTFWMREYAGSSEWHANLEKYGQEAWDLLEKNRKDEAFKNNLYIRD